MSYSLGDCAIVASNPSPDERRAIGTIADQLAQLARALRATGHPDGPALAQAPSLGLSKGDYLAIAERRYQERRRRTALFGNPDLFGEPAWDILLDLYIAYARGLPVSVSSACIGSAVPATTGLRWLGILQEEGLVVRGHDPNDQRRIHVRLSNEGVRRMEHFLRELCTNESSRPVELDNSTEPASRQAAGSAG